MATLPELLTRTVDRGGSDLHLTAGAPPVARVHGELRRLEPDVELSGAETRELIYSMLTAAQRERFERTRELDLAFSAECGRVRCNVFMQRGEVAAVYRIIPETIRDLEALGLPAVVAGLARLPRGLVLVTGPTGCGKSTTLAALIDAINTTRGGHILTIEDPVEVLHPHKRCIVNQREVHQDTGGFAPALRAALREDPDVVLIGEMRDLETIEAALRVAETGHLTFATLHTGSAVQTIDRIVDVFPAHQQGQVRAQLSLVLEGVVCQVLVPTADGMGRVPATEVLIATSAVRHLIRENKGHQVYSVMQSRGGTVGMQTMNQALAGLHRRRHITRDQALSHSSHPDELREMLKRGAPGMVTPVHAGSSG